jgi:hypothetical protein
VGRAAPAALTSAPSPLLLLAPPSMPETASAERSRMSVLCSSSACARSGAGSCVACVGTCREVCVDVGVHERWWAGQGGGATCARAAFHVAVSGCAHPDIAVQADHPSQQHACRLTCSGRPQLRSSRRRRCRCRRHASSASGETKSAATLTHDMRLRTCARVWVCARCGVRGAVRADTRKPPHSGPMVRHEAGAECARACADVPNSHTHTWCAQPAGMNTASCRCCSKRHASMPGALSVEAAVLREA